MKVGKFNDYGEILLIECEQGMEVGGSRSVEELYAEGYKDVCEIEKPGEDAVVSYQEFEGCFVQVWEEEHPEEEGEELKD